MVFAAFFEGHGIDDLLNVIDQAAKFDQQFSEGKALSEREEAVLQALELLTREQSENFIWLKTVDLRETVQKIIGLSPEQMGSAQWIGHLLKQLQLTSPARRKHHAGGKQFANSRAEVLDMMRRYEAEALSE